MGETTGITWCDHTFNPWWGCQRVSPGCEHCYAETLDKVRGGPTGPHWGPTAERRLFKDKHWNEPMKWNRAAEKAGHRARVFCSSMADVFEDRRDLDDERMRLWSLIASTPWLDWLLLTKRPENIARLGYDAWVRDGWPPNAWLGTTTEDQQRADERVPHLLRQRAVVRFVSYEPALGPVLFDNGERSWLSCDGRRVEPGEDCCEGFHARGDHYRGIDWVIVGGESGPGARPFNIEWARATVRQCREAGVAAFVKQLGARPFEQDCSPDIDCFYTLRDRKGGDMAEWSADLRVREFPAVARG